MCLSSKGRLPFPVIYSVVPNNVPIFLCFQFCLQRYCFFLRYPNNFLILDDYYKNESSHSGRNCSRTRKIGNAERNGFHHVSFLPNSHPYHVSFSDEYGLQLVSFPVTLRFSMCLFLYLRTPPCFAI